MMSKQLFKHPAYKVTGGHMKLLTRTFWVALIMSFVVACTGQPVQQRQMTPLAEFGLSINQVEEAIQTGARAKGWRIVSIGNGEAVLDVYVRSHYAKVSVEYSATGYSINYLDSENLDYNARKGTIHRSYNRWVSYLDTEIRNAAFRASAR